MFPPGPRTQLTHSLTPYTMLALYKVQAQSKENRWNS